MFRWPDQQSESGGSGTHMPSPGFVRYRRCAGFLATPRRVLSLSATTLKKTRCGACGRVHRGWYDRRERWVRDLGCGDLRIYLEVEVRRVYCQRCGKVKREQLDFLADNPFYTKRFARLMWVGAVARRRSRTSPRSFIWTGRRSKSWTSSTCTPNSPARQPLGRRSSASMRSRSAQVTIIGSWSATCSEAVRSGLAVRTASRRA